MCLLFHPCPCVLMSWPGQESALGSRAVIGDYIRPLPLPADKPEPLSVRPAFLSRPASPRCRFESDVSSGLACVRLVGTRRSSTFSLPQISISSLHCPSCHHLHSVFPDVLASEP